MLMVVHGAQFRNQDKIDFRSQEENAPNRDFVQFQNSTRPLSEARETWSWKQLPQPPLEYARAPTRLDPIYTPRLLPAQSCLGATSQSVGIAQGLSACLQRISSKNDAALFCEQGCVGCPSIHPVSIRSLKGFLTFLPVQQNHSVETTLCQARCKRTQNGPVGALCLTGSKRSYRNTLHILLFSPVAVAEYSG